MKRMTTLLLSAVLLLSLTACGKTNDNAADDGAGGGNTEQNNPATDPNANNDTLTGDQATDGGGTANDPSMGSNYETPHIDGAQTPAEKSGKNAMNDMKRKTNDAMRDMEETLDGESWDGMVRNGRVRDTDGKLKDGENALHGRYYSLR